MFIKKAENKSKADAIQACENNEVVITPKKKQPQNLAPISN